MSSETLLETAATTSPKATDIFHCETIANKQPLSGMKRKLGENEREREREAGRAKISCSQPGSLISPPLFKPRPALAMVPGYPHSPHEAAQTNGAVNHDAGGAGTSQEDEWKNIKVVRHV